jgi:glycosyltransferase involved in cell wall biosynthesis
MISVIIPSYNPGDYFFDCLDSLNKQTLSKEFYSINIIFNDTDDSIIEKFKDYIESISLNAIIFSLPKAGVSIARNYGIEKSSGSFICFLDDDDIISENYLESLLEISNDNTIGVSNIMVFEENGKFYPYTRTLKSEINNCDVMQCKNLLSTVTAKIIPRNIIKDCRFNENIKNGEDALFMFSISKRVYNIVSTNLNCFYYRRIRNDSAYYRRKKTSYYLINTFYLYILYFFEYLASPFQYSGVFFLNRILAVSKKLLLDLNIIK